MSKKIHVRPGRTQSKVGFAMGLIFCLIGIFVVIPIFGFFGIFWTAIAAGITYMNYRNGFTEEQIDSRVIEVEDDSAEDGGKEDVETRMKKLQSLYDKALITREEYEQKRQEILKDL